MIPDPAFLRFFETEFPERLARVTVPGLANASWDRRAAYLLWLAERGERPAEPSEKPTDTLNMDIFA